MPVTLPMRSEYTDVRAACRPPPATLVLVEANGKGKGVGRGQCINPSLQPAAPSAPVTQERGENRSPRQKRGSSDHRSASSPWLPTDHQPNELPDVCMDGRHIPELSLRTERPIIL